MAALSHGIQFGKWVIYPSVFVRVAEQAVEKGHICHSERVTFAGEGSAGRKKTQGKADFESRSKTERGSE
jgi:hypothetical protein